MRIVEINTVNRGSTGTIMLGIANLARAKGHEVLVCYPCSRENSVKYNKGDYVIGNRYVRNVGRWMSSHFKAEHIIHLTSTYAFIRKLKEFKPDVIHFHNIHDSFLNMPMLFKYIRKAGIHVVWTMHDCWLMTGHCALYVGTGCYKWKQGCKNCQFYNVYPQSFYDDSEYKFRLKGELLSSIRSKLTLTPVSSWLAGELSKSHLRDIRCQVVSNGINVNVFKPTIDDTIRQKFGIPKGRIILAASTAWGEMKGLYDFFKLADMLSAEEHIVLIGLTDKIIRNMPQSIIGLKRTDNVKELAKLYSIADVVLSLSYMETFGLTIVEANACGTPVVVYDNTAQPELISEENGIVVKTGDVDAVYKAIKMIFAKNRDDWRKPCRDSVVNRYSENVTYQKYLDLFEEVIRN